MEYKRAWSWRATDRLSEPGFVGLTDWQDYTSDSETLTKCLIPCRIKVIGEKIRMTPLGTTRISNDG